MVTREASDSRAALTGDTCFIAHAGGLSEDSWTICGPDGEALLHARRPGGAAQSAITLALGGLALVGVLLFNGVLAILGAWALGPVLAVGGLCFAATLLLAFFLAFRRVKPVVLLRSEHGPALLEIHAATRFLSFVYVRFDVRHPDGTVLGRLSHAPVLQLVRTAWRIEPEGTPFLQVIEPSWAAALGRRLGDLAPILTKLAHPLGVGRRGAPPSASRKRFVVTRPPVPEPVATCDEHPGPPRWTSLEFSPAASPTERALILSAVMLAARER